MRMTSQGTPASDFMDATSPAFTDSRTPLISGRRLTRTEQIDINGTTVTKRVSTFVSGIRRDARNIVRATRLRGCQN
jgi:hypothetical protein